MSLDVWKKAYQQQTVSPPDPTPHVGESLPQVDQLPALPDIEEPPAVSWDPILVLDKGHQIFCMAIAAGRKPSDALKAAGETHITMSRAEFLLKQPVIMEELRTYIKPLLMQPDLAKVWASRRLEEIEESSITDFLQMRNEREYVRHDDGTLVLDDQARPVFNLMQRMVLNPDLMNLPRAKLKTIRKIRIKRRAEGDEIEVEMYDRHKAIMDLAFLAGLRPAPAPAPEAEGEKEVYATYENQLNEADMAHGRKLQLLRDKASGTGDARST